MKLTPWFPGDVKPVRVGVYQRDYSGTTFSCHRSQYCYWNGKFWSIFSFGPLEALEFKRQKSTLQNLPWRGVAK